MNEKLKILHLEDSPVDAELVEAMLKSSGLDVEIHLVDNKKDYLTKLKTKEFDLILSDFHLPGWNGLEALVETKTIDADTPFIYVSGTIGEDRAVQCLQLGAMDYVIKDRIDRIVPAVKRALLLFEEKNERKRAEQLLMESELRYRNLVENTFVGVFESTLAGKILYGNKALSHMLGFHSHKEFISMDVSFKFKKIVGWGNLLSDINESGFVENFETELVAQDGSFRSVLFGAKQIGKIISGMVVDITGIKHSDGK